MHFLLVCCFWAISFATCEDPVTTPCTSQSALPNYSMLRPKFPRAIRSPVPRLTLEPSVQFARDASLADGPLVFRNTAASALWEAFQKWSPATLGNRIPELHGVKRTADPQHTFYYYHGAPMNAFPEIVGDYESKSQTILDKMTSKEFFGQFRQGEDISSPSVYSYAYAGKLDTWPDEVVVDVLPIDFLMVLPTTFDPTVPHKYRQTWVWCSPKGVITPTHYDLYHNFFVQIHGRKHFLLLQPEAWEQIYLYPILHPGQRSTQINMTAVWEMSTETSSSPSSASSTSSSSSSSTSSSTSSSPGGGRVRVLDDHTNNIFTQNFPNYHDLSIFEVVLEPGDVLYIPPMWFHRVTALDDSISLSVWSPYEPAETAESVIRSLPLPILKEWGIEQRVASLRVYIGSLVANLPDFANSSAADFIDWTLLRNRYLHIPPLIPDTTPPEDRQFCHNDEVMIEVLAELKPQLQSVLSQAVARFKTVREQAGVARRDMLLADIIELSVNEVVGTSNVKQFLSDFVYC